MNRIHVSGIISPLFQWTHEIQKQITSHAAWKGTIDQVEAEDLLKNSNPFTYLLRSDKKENSYFISYVGEDRTIRHQFFILDPDHEKWRYQNGCANSCHDLNKLIPLMMHCDPEVCHPF